MRGDHVLSWDDAGVTVTGWVVLAAAVALTVAGAAAYAWHGGRS